MDIFKFFFHHDLRLDQLADDKAPADEGTLEDFMTPTLTFSRFYLTGTLLEEQQIGLSCLDHKNDVLVQLGKALNNFHWHSPSSPDSSLKKQVEKLSPRNALIGSPSPESRMTDLVDQLRRNTPDLSSVKDPLQTVLKEKAIVLYKEEAEHGYDIQILSMNNIYESFFHAFKKLISEQFRFFSINSKRINNQRKFYFELHSIDRPPHGAEEVHKDTVLYQ